jgi:flagellin
MLNINSNYAASFASNAAKSSSQGLNSAMEKLSTGMRINYAKDDAAGQAISTRLSAEVQGLQMASRNAADAQSMIDTAEGALQETHNVLLRMRELAVQSANGTLTDGDRAHTDAEFDQLVAEVTRIANNTTWAGKNLLDGSVDGFAGTPAGADPAVDPAVPARPALSFQIGEGAGANQQISVEIDNMSAGSLGTANGTTGVALTTAGLDTVTKAQTAIISIDNAIDSVSKARGEMGAVSNRLSSTMSNLDQVAVNLSASQGRIQDADFAQETGNLAKNQILQQAATAMIAQANASKSSVLTLVRG